MMNVSKVSFNTSKAAVSEQNTRTADTSAPKKSSVPSFSRVTLGNLNEAEIKSLYMDGKDLFQFVQEIMPVLEKKFSNFFDATLNIIPNVQRTVNLRVKANPQKMDALKKHIVDNNRDFEFPKLMIIDFQENYNLNFDSWLKEESYEAFKTSLDDAGNIKNLKKIITDFTKTKTENQMISDIYNLQTREFSLKEKKSIPSYYWEFPGG